MKKKSNNQNEKMMLDVYKNLDMATWTIDLIDDEILNDDFLDLVKKQKKIYEDYKCKVLKMADKFEIDLKSINIMAKIGSLTNIKVGTFFDNSNSHIANKLIQGTSMGIIELKKALNSYKILDDEIKEVANNLYVAESKFFTSLQEFL